MPRLNVMKTLHSLTWEVWIHAIAQHLGGGLEPRWLSSHYCSIDAVAPTPSCLLPGFGAGYETASAQQANDAYLVNPHSSILQALQHHTAQLAAEYDTAAPTIHSSPPPNPARCVPSDFFANLRLAFPA